MSGYFASGRAIDVVLVVMLLEIAWLQRRGKPLSTLLLAVLPGAAILLALRAALTGAPWHIVALCLTVSLPLHLADMRHRRLI